MSQRHGDRRDSTGAQRGDDPTAEAGKFAASAISGDQAEDGNKTVSEASTAVNKHLGQILAQIQTGDYDSAIENIGFAIGDDFEELIEAGVVQDGCVAKSGYRQEASSRK